MEQGLRQRSAASRDTYKASIAEAVIGRAKALTHGPTLVSGSSRPAMLPSMGSFTLPK